MACVIEMYPRVWTSGLKALPEKAVLLSSPLLSLHDPCCIVYTFVHFSNLVLLSQMVNLKEMVKLLGFPVRHTAMKTCLLLGVAHKNTFQSPKSFFFLLKYAWCRKMGTYAKHKNPKRSHVRDVNQRTPLQSPTRVQGAGIFLKVQDSQTTMWHSFIAAYLEGE